MANALSLRMTARDNYNSNATDLSCVLFAVEPSGIFYSLQKSGSRKKTVVFACILIITSPLKSCCCPDCLQINFDNRLCKEFQRDGGSSISGLGKREMDAFEFTNDRSGQSMQRPSEPRTAKPKHLANVQ